MTPNELRDLAKVLRETYFKSHGVAHATYSNDILTSWDKVAAKAVEILTGKKHAEKSVPAAKAKDGKPRRARRG